MKKKSAGLGQAPKKSARKPRRAMSPAQKKNAARLSKAHKECKVSHEPFTKSFGACMKDWFKKN